MLTLVSREVIPLRSSSSLTCMLGVAALMIVVELSCFFFEYPAFNFPPPFGRGCVDIPSPPEEAGDTGAAISTIEFGEFPSVDVVTIGSIRPDPPNSSCPNLMVKHE